jgi:hypothetical protein
MTDSIRFTLDGREVEAAPGESIAIPHLCWRRPRPSHGQPAEMPDEIFPRGARLSYRGESKDGGLG